MSLRVNVCAITHSAYLGLGSNLGAGPQMLALATRLLAFLPGVQPLAQSSLYLTEPQDYREQPWFANKALKLGLAEHWTPLSLLDALLALETLMGRTRGAVRYGPRRIDLDLLLFDNIELQTAHCALPHPRMTRRAFVLLPLKEIEPRLKIKGKTCGQWLQALNYRLQANKIYQE